MLRRLLAPFTPSPVNVRRPGQLCRRHRDVRLGLSGRCLQAGGGFVDSRAVRSCESGGSPGGNQEQVSGRAAELVGAVAVRPVGVGCYEPDTAEAFRYPEERAPPDVLERGHDPIYGHGALSSERADDVLAVHEGVDQRVQPARPRSDQRAKGELYLRGLMLDGKRKSMQSMAARLGVDHQQLQQFVTSSTWDYGEVRQRPPSRWADRYLRPEAYVVDDSGFPKEGSDSAGVARLYSGQPCSATCSNAWAAALAVQARLAPHVPIWTVVGRVTGWRLVPPGGG
jgi:hypothetical protein